jgi:hypothetical protein
MKNPKLVAESIEDFYGPGYTSTSTGENLPNAEENIPNYSAEKELQSEVVEDIVKNYLDFEKLFDSDEKTIVKIITNTVDEYVNDFDKSDPDVEWEVMDYAKDNVANIAEEIYIKVLQQLKFRTNDQPKTSFDGRDEDILQKIDATPKRGWATYYALEALEKAGDTGMRYMELVRAMYNGEHGEGAHEGKDLRGYLSGNFRGKTSYGRSHGEGPMYKYADKNSDGRYVINDSGRKYLQRFKQRIEK